MTIAVSYTEFRNDLSKYLDLLKKGKKVVIRNAKKSEKLVTLVSLKEKEFDWDEHLQFIDSVGGKLFTDADVKMIAKIREKSKKRSPKHKW